MSKRKHKKFDPMAAIEENETLRRLNPQLAIKPLSVVLTERFNQDGVKIQPVKERGAMMALAHEKPYVIHQDTLKFTIPGQPVGKPRMSQQDKWKKRPCVMRYRSWSNKARASVPAGAVLSIYREISFKAYLEFPKSYSMTRRHILAGNPHHQKPDVDNIIKSVGDSLFPEDKFIWKISGEKRWDDGVGARVEVELRT